MSIEDEKLKVQCPVCQNNIILTFNTIKCPKCGADFNPDEVKQVFYNYESQISNSKLYNIGEKFQKAGTGMQKAGDGLSNLGCTLMLIPIALIALVIIWALTQS